MVIVFDGDSVRNLIILSLVSLAALVVIVLVLSVAIPAALFSGPALFEKSIAVIPLKGEIFSSSDGYSRNYTAEELVKVIDEASNDPAIGVIFLDIDSPGGGVVATKQIVAKIREVDKPVIAYIGDVGASGGYYVAAAADEIIADEDSLTGSIGVISMVYSMVELLDNLGVEVTTVTAGKNKDIGSPFSELTEGQRKMLQEIVDQAMEGFKGDIIEFRGDKLDMAVFDELTDGRILSGRQAWKAGLIDGLGTKEYAFERAAELGGIEGEPIFEIYGKGELTIFDIFTQAGSSFGNGISSRMLPSNEGLKS
ncbi:MAG: signal peptide peptidase SppA [Candidatus Diapherotrites archaeon]